MPAAKPRSPQSVSRSTAQEQARAEALFASIGEGAVVTDEDGRISRINQAALEMLEVKEQTILGEWYPRALPAHDAEGNEIPLLRQPITRAFISGKTVTKRIYLKRAMGKPFPVSMTVSPFLFKGKPIGAVVLFRDITHEVEIERMKDEFVSIASHQLRTPATGVKQYVGMILEGYAGHIGDEVKVLLKQAYESNERQLQVITDLLKVAHVDAGQIRLEREEVNVNRLVRDVLDEQADNFKERQQKMKLKVPRRQLLVRADEARIRMVLENLVDNARKYTPIGKTVSVEAFERDDQVCVGVMDEGVGIAKKDLGKLFKKFSRIDNELSHTASSTGLGLYWAKKIVDLHGGQIEVESEQGVGSTFRLVLPKERSNLQLKRQSLQSNGTK